MYMLRNTCSKLPFIAAGTMFSIAPYHTSSSSSSLTLDPLKYPYFLPQTNCKLTIMNIPVTLPFPDLAQYHPMESKISPALQDFLSHDLQNPPKSHQDLTLLLNAKIDLLTSATFPYVRPFKDVMISAKWCMFLFYHDDYVEELTIDIKTIKKLHDILIESMESPFQDLSHSNLNTLPLSPKEKTYFIKIQKILVSIFQDLLNDDFQTSAAFPYFKKEVQQYLDSTIQELHLKSQLKSLDHEKKELQSQLYSLTATADSEKDVSFNFGYYPVINSDKRINTKQIVSRLDQINQSLIDIHNTYNHVRLGSGSVDSFFMLGASLTRIQNVWSTPKIKWSKPFTLGPNPSVIFFDPLA